MIAAEEIALVTVLAWQSLRAIQIIVRRRMVLCRMSPEETETVRSLRGFAIPWKTIARKLGRTVDECRQSIGLPPADQTATQRPALPWEQKQRTLFDQ